MLAAAADPRSVAYLGLDAVDSGELASTVAGLPRALFLFGEPSPCNADGNMVGTAGALLQYSGASPAPVLLRIPFATHCDFENPYDDACERLCGTVEPPQTAEEIRTTVRAVATAWLVEIAAAPAEPGEAIEQSVIGRLEAAQRVIRLDAPPRDARD